MKPSASAATRLRLKNHDRGFALMVTISMMVLMVLLAVGLLSLSTVSLRSSARSNALVIAKANARMALTMAIGELQKTMGPDQRISASSAILDSSPDTVQADGIGQPHVTGVWNSWKWRNGDSSPDYDSKKDSDFVQWLVSAADPEDREDRDFVSSEAADPVALIGDGTSEDPEDHVDAGRITLEEENGSTSSIAWAVFDEGQKARVSLPTLATENRNSRIDQLAAPTLPGYETVEEWAPIRDAEKKSQTVSLRTMELLGIEPRDQSTFHSLSPFASNLMTNVGDGGFSHDLNLLFDNERLPDDFYNRYIYSDEDTPLVGIPSRFRRANPIPSPDPGWRQLHSHYRMYDRIENQGGKLSVQASNDRRPPSLGSGRRRYDFFEEQQLLPVIAKAQFVFSLSAGWHPVMTFWPMKNVLQQDEKYVAWFCTDPVITLWNPYNVELRFSQSEIELYRIPLRFVLYKNDERLSPNGTHFANLFSNNDSTGDWNKRENRFYKLNILPKPDEDEVVIKPGEYMVFTPHNHAYHWNQGYATKGLDLRPGFYPPAGNDSNPNYVGGATALNIIIDDAGNPAYQVPGVNRGLNSAPLAVGDTLGVSVYPEKAGVDSFPETNNQEIAIFTKYYQGTGSSRQLIGGVELDYDEDKMEEHLPSYGPDELSEFLVTPDIPEGIKADNVNTAVGSGSTVANMFKRPFLIASLHLKTEQDSLYPSRSWIHNSPINTYATSGLDQTEDFSAHQYEFNWEPMYDWKDIPGVQLDTLDRGYGGSGLYSDSGVHVTPFASIPLVPPISMGQLRHAPLNVHGQLPLTTQIVGNSYASPLVDRASTTTAGTIGTYVDHSFLANNRLFDNYFMSSATTQDTQLHSRTRSLENVLGDFFAGDRDLPNRHFRPVLHPGPESEALASDLPDDDDGYQKIGSQLFLDGAFNVNSTSLNAWKLFLASGTMETIPIIDALSSSLVDTDGEGTVVSRNLPPTGEDFEDSQDPAERDNLRWSGHRRLDAEQVELLAEAAIEQVKRRGPFQSISEFVNRRLENGENGLHGALQAAIEESGLNDEFDSYGIPIQAGDDSLADSEAATGNSVDGSPTTINQADLLTPLAPFITVRSDTFRIRAYGEAKEPGGQIARAWCEAVVQRFPEYVDSETETEERAIDLPEDSVNGRFGRRMKIVSFRWLSSDEV